MNTRCSNRMYGFTLIELLVVFTLIALLLSIATPRYLSALDSSREKARMQNMSTIRDAIDKYKADAGHLPHALADLVSRRYLRAIPPDPVSNSTDWVTLADPGKAEAGVFDIAPPVEARMHSPP